MIPRFVKKAIKVISSKMLRNKLRSIKHPKMVKIDGIMYPIFLRPRKMSSDTNLFFHVFRHAHYEIPYPQKSKVIIDAGANIGLFSIKLKNLFPEAKIICIEPEKANFESLKINLSKYENVYLENAGLWDKPTRLKVYNKDSQFSTVGFVVEEDSAGNLEAVSLYQLMKKYNIDRIDVLKIDIEGSEKQVFAKGYEGWITKVKMFVIECHDRMEKGCTRAFFEAINKSLPNYSSFTAGENIVIVNGSIE